MRWIADFFYLLAGLTYLPIALYQIVIVGKNRRGWGERFGGVRSFDRDKPRIWLHAVSLGEVNCTPQLVSQLKEERPDYEIVVSTTTDTGFARAVQLYGRENVFRFPLDFSVVVSRVLERINPQAIVLVELEVWYNLVRMATRRGVPVVVVNGRLTERSAKRFRYIHALCRPMFSDLKWVGAQDEAIAARFQDLGVDPQRVEVTSSLKWDTAMVADHIEGEDELAAAMDIDRKRPLWVCGSTGPGEEAIILDAYRKLLDDKRSTAEGRNDPSAKGEAVPLLTLVPRKPERFDEVARLIGRTGFVCVRRSERQDGQRNGALKSPSVLLGDTMGELRKFYSLADVVLVGRSLVPMGGSDPIEVAALGKPIIVGPHMSNFRLPVEALAARDAIRQLADGSELAAAVASLLADPAVRRELGARAREVVLAHQGATQRTIDGIIRILKASSAR
ncbi:MAG: 3-deoxy-D-manno-octulosonic acid transferase [Planctomycetes bacterium]|nr:3-deoxy-D-manno-octulosonic acid transferase [Planctomycetota bacterium]